jgi:uncharacterized protein (TIGR03083 family)
MDYEQHGLAVERESAAIVEGLRAGPLNVQVPTCPEWTLVELATHLGQFCGLWSHVICEATGKPKTPFEEPEQDEARAAWFAGWFEEQSGLLMKLLGSVHADTRAWTWDPGQNTAGFIARRAAHELAVHRFDVQSARSDPEPIDGQLAVDGIEEIFALVGAWRASAEDMGVGHNETLHLHASAPEAEWTITLSPAGPRVERSHRKADLALRGSASDLELTLYDRPPIGQVEHIGDDNALAVWHRAFRFE